jgi:hypothetical protein
MRKNCRLAHAWVESKAVRWKSQVVQTFFQGPNRKYFAVTIPDGDLLAESTQSSGLQNLIESVLQEASKRDITQRALHKVSDVQFLVAKTPWLRRTGWGRIFVRKEMAKVVELTSKATRDERALDLVCMRMKRVIHNCVNGVQYCVDRYWSLIPFWSASAQRDKEGSKPFRTYTKDRSVRLAASLFSEINADF